MMANMTLYAPDGLMMVLLEEFDTLTSAIDCQGDDGTLSLTFNSPNAYQYALKTWGHINANAHEKFLLIANHKGCGPDEMRQPYLCVSVLDSMRRLSLTNTCRISSIREDPASLTTFLAAEPAPWSDIGGSYDLDFGRVSPYSTGLQQRHWWNGNFDVTKNKDFITNIGHPDKIKHLYHDDSQVV